MWLKVFITIYLHAIKCMGTVFWLSPLLLYIAGREEWCRKDIYMYSELVYQPLCVFNCSCHQLFTHDCNIDTRVCQMLQYYRCMSGD